LESVYFVVVGILLYFGADWILNRMEIVAGRRFEYRSFIFFAILLTLALVTFAIIRQYAGKSV
jgi:hypothetical protein